MRGVRKGSGGASAATIVSLPVLAAWEVHSFIHSSQPPMVNGRLVLE